MRATTAPPRGWCNCTSGLPFAQPSLEKTGSVASQVGAAAACRGSMAHSCTVPAEPRPAPQGSTAATWQQRAEERAPSPWAPHSFPAPCFHPQPPPDRWAALAAPRPTRVLQSCQEALVTPPSGHVYLHEKNHRHRARRCLPAGTASRRHRLLPPARCRARAGWVLCPATARPLPLHRARAESLCRCRIFRGWGQRQVPGCVDSPETGGGICW